VASLADLGSKKILVPAVLTTLFWKSVGAEKKWHPPWRSRKLPGACGAWRIDCAVTGAGSVYSSGWYGIFAPILFKPAAGWLPDPVITAVNLDAWEALDPAVASELSDRAGQDRLLKDLAWKMPVARLPRDIAWGGLFFGGTPGGKFPGVNGAAGASASMDTGRAERGRIQAPRHLKCWKPRSCRIGQSVLGDWAQRWNESVRRGIGVYHQPTERHS